MSTLEARSVSVIVVAAGEGRRMGTRLRKPWIEIAGAPVVVHTLRRFAALEITRQLVLVVHPGDLARGEALSRSFERLTIVPGGDSRVASVRAGLSAADADAPLIAIQDGVRPLVSEAIIRAACAAAHRTGAALPVAPVHATLKQVCADSNRVLRTVPRDGLYEAQTPQVFRANLIRRAYDALTIDDVTDDAQVVELLGEAVTVVPGSPHNLKITTPEDLKLAEILLSS